MAPRMPESPTTTSTRYHSLDALRGLLMMYGIFVHASTLGPSPTPETLAMLSGLVRMEAFFVVSGFLSMMLVRKYGTRLTLVKRFASIGIPFAFTLVALNPMTNWLVYSYHNAPIPIWDYLIGSGVSPDAKGPMVWHLHVWFLLTLLLYALVTPLASTLVDGLRSSVVLRRAETLSGALVFALMGAGVAGACLALRAFNDLVLEIPLSHTPFAFIVRSALVYFPFLFLGMLLYAVPWLHALFERMHWIHLVVAVALVVAAWLGFDALPKLVAETFKLTSEAYLAVCATSSLFCLFRRIVPTERPVARYLSDAAYTVYLLHYLTIYVLAWALRPLLGENQLMYAVVVVGTMVITLLIYHYPVSRIRLAGILFNGKLPVGRPSPRPAALGLGTASAD